MSKMIPERFFALQIDKDFWWLRL